MWTRMVSRRTVFRPALLACLCVTPWLASTPTAQTNGIRQVSASSQSLIALQTRLRYTTMVVLPEDEEILDIICGDKDFWVISATHNIAHVKPAKEAAATKSQPRHHDRHRLFVPVPPFSVSRHE